MKRIRLASIVFAAVALTVAAFAASASAAPVFSLTSKYGGYGYGEGSFRFPKGIDTDSAGNVWIAGGDDGRIIKLSPEGVWLKQITGTSAHKYDYTYDVATTPNGTIWVAASYNTNQYVLEEINEKGEFIREASPTGCGCTWHPWEVVADSKGRLWVNGDTTHAGRIYNFTAEGVSGTYVTNLNEGLTIDAKDTLWVSSYENKRLDGYDPSGTYVGQIGSFFYWPGQATVDTAGNFWVMDGSDVVSFSEKNEYLYSEFSPENPCCLAPALNGNLWLVAWTNGGQIQKWTAAPKATTSAADATTATLKGTVNPSGVETTYRFEYGTTTSYGTKIPVPDKSVGSGTTDVSVSQTAENLKGTTTYHFRIVATNSYGTTYGEDKTFVTPGWTLPSNPKASGAKYENLFGVSCTGSENCVAVGQYENSTGISVTLAKVKSAGKWSVTSTPNPEKSTLSYLNGVDCTAANACTAVGGNNTASTTIAERWNGSTWAIQSTPNVAGALSSRLWSVSCVASNDCTAVGWSTSTGAAATLAEHWNGTTWTIMPTPNAAGFTKSYLYGISCLSASDCWAVGMATNASEPQASLAEHWDGTKWTVNSPAGSQNMNDIVCVSASSCVATTGRNTVLSRWNGSTWSQETAPKPEGAVLASLSGISCTAANACKAVGAWGIKRWQPLAESWNGSTWSIESTSEPAGTLDEAKLAKVSCTSSTVCTSVGTYFPQGGPRWSLLEARY